MAGAAGPQPTTVPSRISSGLMSSSFTEKVLWARGAGVAASPSALHLGAFLLALKAFLLLSDLRGSARVAVRPCAILAAAAFAGPVRT